LSTKYVAGSTGGPFHWEEREFGLVWLSHRCP